MLIIISYNCAIFRLHQFLPGTNRALELPFGIFFLDIEISFAAYIFGA